MAEFPDHRHLSQSALFDIVYHLSEDEGNSDAALCSVHSDEKLAAQKSKLFNCVTLGCAQKVKKKKNRTTTTTRKLSLGHQRVSFKLSNIGVYKEATSRDVDRVHQKGDRRKKGRHCSKSQRHLKHGVAREKSVDGRRKG